jgi:hypothetical protein
MKETIEQSPVLSSRVKELETKVKTEIDSFKVHTHHILPSSFPPLQHCLNVARASLRCQMLTCAPSAHQKRTTETKKMLLDKMEEAKQQFNLKKGN